MREAYFVVVVAVDETKQRPAEYVDFVDWDVKTPDGKPAVRHKYCCWCGKKFEPGDDLRIVGARKS